MTRLTPAQRLEVCSRYMAGESSEALGRRFGVSGAAIRGLLKRRSIRRRTQEEAQRKYTINHSFFASISSESQAYWLGFIAADGNISGNELSISLQADDGSHLVRFLNDINGTHRVRYYDYGELRFCRISIRSKELVTDLARYGITANKTFTLPWPTLPDELLRHFVRGYVDGDGGFFGGRNPTFHVTGNEMFVAALQAFLMQKCDLNKTRPYRRRATSPIATLRYTGRCQVARIFDFLYTGASIWLPRKRHAIEPSLRKYLASGGMSAAGGPPSTGLSCQPAQAG